MINANAPKGGFVKYIVDVIKFYVNHHFMVVTVSKVIVPQIIAHVLIMEGNAIPKDVKIVMFKNLKK
jgi:hypothetical protein